MIKMLTNLSMEADAVLHHLQADGALERGWIARVLRKMQTQLASIDRSASAQPVAWGRVLGGKCITISPERTFASNEPLYAHPPAESSGQQVTGTERAELSGGEVTIPAAPLDPCDVAQPMENAPRFEHKHATQLYHCLSALHEAVKAIARYGFERDVTTDLHAASLWRDLNEYQRATEKLLLAYKYVAAAPAGPDMVSAIVDRFLRWPLPKTFSPDCGITFDGRGLNVFGQTKQWPIGTNLFNAEEARQMIEYLIDADPQETWPAYAAIVNVQNVTHGRPIEGHGLDGLSEAMDAVEARQRPAEGTQTDPRNSHGAALLMIADLNRERDELRAQIYDDAKFLRTLGEELESGGDRTVTLAKVRGLRAKVELLLAEQTKDTEQAAAYEKQIAALRASLNEELTLMENLRNQLDQSSKDIEELRTRLEYSQRSAEKQLDHDIEQIDELRDKIVASEQAQRQLLTRCRPYVETSVIEHPNKEKCLLLRSIDFALTPGSGNG